MPYDNSEPRQCQYRHEGKYWKCVLDQGHAMPHEPFGRGQKPGNPKLCQQHAEDREAFGETGHVIVNDGDCEKCCELSGRDPYNRDMTEPYEP